MTKRNLILCVEDEADLRRDIVEELSEAGYEVQEACNGEIALEKLRETRPDLILCDISMPGNINGYDLLGLINAEHCDLADVPFVFLSALADPRQITNGKRVGADDYLTKPIDYDLLLATVDARLRQVARIRALPVKAGPDRTGALDQYGLTPAETRVALALSQGGNLAQISKDFGISRSTVAFHLRNIFQKTGTRRQADLILLLLDRPKF